MGGESSVEAIEQSQQLGLDIIAKCYLVILIKIELPESTQPFDYDTYQQVERMMSGLIKNHPNALLTKKDLEEFVLIMKGDLPEQLDQEGVFLAGLIKNEMEEKSTCSLAIGIGSPQERLGNIHSSFAEALARVEASTGKGLPLGYEDADEKVELLKLEQSALENYLKCGITDDFDEFFDTYIQPLGEAALRSYLVKHYIFMDTVLTTAQFVSDLGGDVEKVIPELHDVERLLENTKTTGQIREEMKKIFLSALTFRNSQVFQERTKIIHQAKSYIDSRFSDPDLSLNEVAAQVNLSPSYFSTVFSNETGETFRDYLTRIRIHRARELLRTTNLKCSEVAYKSGYNDPHYFSYIFRKNTGLAPQQFRVQPSSRKK
jgi:two-component system response regulator YesN